MKVALIDTLTQPLLDQATAYGADTIVSVNIAMASEAIPAHVQIIDAKYANQVPASWLLYQQNEALFARLSARRADLFSYRKVDLSVALLKGVYWFSYTNETSLAQASLQILRQENTDCQVVLDLTRPKLGWYLKQVLKGLRGWLSRRKGAPVLPVLPELPPCRYLFIITDALEALFWSRLIAEMPATETMVIFAAPEKEYTEIAASGYYHTWQQAGLSMIRVPLPDSGAWHIPWFRETIIPSGDIGLWNHLATLLPEVWGYADWCTALFQQIQPAVVVVNCLEMSWKGNIICGVAHQHGVRVFNTSNGLHAPSAERSQTCFDVWAVWDEPTRLLLEQGCRVPAGQVQNLGCHLAEDLLRSHRYTGSIPFLQQLAGQKIILFCGAPGMSANKVQAVETLYDLLDQHPGWTLIYRPHPGEAKEDFLLPASGRNCHPRVFVSQYARNDAKQSLYDQLLICHLTVVLGSTVAIESRHMGVKTITYELASPPFIYFADGNQVFHADTPAVLAHLLEKIVPEAIPQCEAATVVAGTPPADRHEAATVFARAVCSLASIQS